MIDDTNWLGKEIGNYCLISKINSGTFGTVFRARHLIFEDDPPVAIKILHAPFHTPQERKEFVQEAQVLKKLSHPHILRILDAGFHNGLPYLVTEYAAGGSLRDQLTKQSGQPLEPTTALTTLTQVAQALHYAHQQNIVHRDLKPENILYNGKGEAVLADFGIAVILSTSRTIDTSLAGTPAYMAPEQFEGKISTRSDQYALGCIAYELLTGRQPFQVKGMRLEAIWYHHAQVTPTSPTQLNPRISIDAEKAILRALAKVRGERFDDVAAFVAALQTMSKSAMQWFQEGYDLYNLGRYEEAIAAYERAIELKPDYAVAYNNKGEALDAWGRYEEAIVACNRAIELKPDYANAYDNKGISLHNLGRYEEAIGAYNQAIELKPDLADAYNNKGLALDKLKRSTEAQQFYEKAKQLGYRP